MLRTIPFGGVGDWELHRLQVVESDGHLPAPPAVGDVELLLHLDDAPDEGVVELHVLHHGGDKPGPDPLDLLLHGDVVSSFLDLVSP